MLGLDSQRGRSRREISAMNFNRPSDAGSPRQQHGSMAGVYAFSAALMIIGLFLIY